MSQTQRESFESFYDSIKPNDGKVYGYALKNVREFRTFRGVAWEGQIFRNGVKIGAVSNDGNGGSHNYWFSEVSDRNDFDWVVKAAYEGRDTVDVPADCFINWLDRENV